MDRYDEQAAALLPCRDFAGCYRPIGKQLPEVHDPFCWVHRREPVAAALRESGERAENAERERDEARASYNECSSVAHVRWGKIEQLQKELNEWVSQVRCLRKLAFEYHPGSATYDQALRIFRLLDKYDLRRGIM